MARDKPPISDFYFACRNGDVEFVKQMLEEAECDLNCLESNGSTPLHAACYYGHEEIVQLLIAHNCGRSQINSHGLTAYEEAANDEIRQLFKRPGREGSQRFQDESVDNSFDFVHHPNEEDMTTTAATPATATPAATSASDSVSTVRKPPVQGYKTKEEKKLEIGYATTSITMCQSKLARFVVDRFQHDAPMSVKSIGLKLQEIIDKEIIAKEDPQSQKATDLLNKFLNEKDNDHRIEYLIHLYTLETRFYGALKANSIPLALPLYMKLQRLKERYFQGESYRGAKMTNDDISAYEWAVDNRGSLLQTSNFSSTSVHRSIAEEFADKPSKPNDTRNRVLFIFDFPRKCDQAINLNRISDKSPCLSEYEDEGEILILPWTLFEVKSVNKEANNGRLSYTIHLVNVILPRKSLLSTFKWTLKNTKGCLDRFNEYFPEHEPKFIASQLKINALVFDKNVLQK
ncbi:unnamed protein product [Didymodactylos carnosus]|uniref:NAD(+)--protein-arginine ADP-ribosyltransferase n=1 Tax=Didymodactylos carnosus TaxID=1234261 RepID=A0A814R0I7_9BILA|nr:unnamed protein product [Didymodactylos carnosus]CAF3890635.1 unnamed protein product [Didymodactylos carnosus]